MKARPKYNPVYDDYSITFLENGEYIEFATTKDFSELFDWANEADKRIKELEEELKYTDGIAEKRENEKLRERIEELKAFTVHDSQCAIWNNFTPLNIDSSSPKCTCGLEQALNKD